MTTNNKVFLCIMDGIGYYKDYEGNAFTKANTPNLDRLLKDCPNSNINAAGEFVGLPDGQMGNSEVGHTNIGAGRVVYQLLPRINNSIMEKTLEKNEKLIELIKTTKENNSAINLAGLLSDGGVHSHINHLLALCDIFANAQVKVNIHAILDGRDTAPKSAMIYLEKLENHIKDMPNINIATLSGRYYAMDRNNSWDKIEKAYTAIIGKCDEKFSTYQEAIESNYANDITDEFTEPCTIGNFDGTKDGDTFMFFNFRADRARQFCQAFVNENFSEFKTYFAPSYCLGIAEYSEELNKYMTTLFPATKIKNSLGEIISNNGKTQLRIAETEKFAHVTFFLNGGEEKEFNGEERSLIPSPDVATFDLKPEMSAFEITDKIETDLPIKKYDLVILNYANGDMVGHTGDLPASIKAVETTDECIGRLEKLCKENGYTLLITADHGNCEQEINEETGKAFTAHTINPVPLITVNNDKITKISDGSLCDIAPTILEIMELKKPTEMTGKSLIKN